MSTRTHRERFVLVACTLGLSLTSTARALDITEFEKFTAAIPDAE